MNYLLTFYGTSKGILCDKNKVLHFLCRFIKASMRKKYISLLFLPIYRIFAHLRRNFFWIPLHLYNGIKSRIWANIHPTFFTLVTSKQKILSLIQRNLEALWPPKFLAFYKSFTNGERTPLTFYANSKAHWANIFSLLLQEKKKAPHFTRDFRSTLTTLKSFFLQIVYIRTHTRLKEGSLENFRIQTISKNKKVGSYKKSD